MTDTPINKELNPHLSKTKIDKTDAKADIETNTKGSKILDEDINPTPHVNDGDNAARQPDRRDQQGQAFDGGINDENLATVDKHGEPHLASDDITDNNKYASVQNAQRRSL